VFQGKRLKQLQAIIHEVRYPWLDLRKPLREPTMEEMFTVVTGESDYSLHPGLHVGCKVIEIRQSAATIIIDSGIRGFVRISKVSDERVEDISQVLKVWLQLLSSVITTNGGV
jgi:transcription elongation factor SPT6